MTKEQAKQLIPEKSFVGFAGSTYKVAEVRPFLNGVFISVYDEPPSLHTDLLNIKNVEFLPEKL